MQPMHIRVAAQSESQRAANEDSFVVADLTRGVFLTPLQMTTRFDIGERGALIAVSDGMGGHIDGDVASSLVVQTLARQLVNAESTAPSDELLNDAVEKAHEVVRDVGDNEHHNGMGATLTALLVRGSKAWLAEVGGSRAYLVRAGDIAQLTHDQNFAQLLLDKGVLTDDELEASPLRHVLVQAMGHGRAVRVALGQIELRDHDAFVLCSDGLTNCVADDEIKGIVLGSPRLDSACADLVDLAKQRGGEDDITVIVAGVAGALPQSRVDEPISETFEVVAPFAPVR